MLLLDTSFLVELETEKAAGITGPAHRFIMSRPGVPVALSMVTLGEFAEGFADKRDVEDFLSRFKVLQLSREIAYKAAAMQRALSQRLGENDAWIAATALAYNAELVGQENAFKRVPRLKYSPLKS
jgi:predicted nucleic acid-binding protein